LLKRESEIIVAMADHFEALASIGDGVGIDIGEHIVSIFSRKPLTV